MERLCKASAEAKFNWTMPSRRQTLNSSVYYNKFFCKVMAFTAMKQ